MVLHLELISIMKVDCKYTKILRYLIEQTAQYYTLPCYTEQVYIGFTPSALLQSERGNGIFAAHATNAVWSFPNGL